MSTTAAGQFIVRLIAVSLLAGHSVNTLAQLDYRVAFVRNKQICVTGPSRAINCLTNDGRNKYFPVWSREGDRIAYIEIGDNPSVLSTLYVIDRHGKRLAQVQIKPISADEIRSGMRYVESLEWVSSNRLAVSGSVNPSSAEYLVVDIAKMKVTDEFGADGFGASFSPDGRSYAAVTGAPHFSPKESHAPALVVDGRRLTNLVPHGAEIAGAPTWAPDGSTIAIPLRNTVGAPNAGIDSVVLWQRDSGAKHSINVPAHTRDLRWGGSGLIAITPGDLSGQLAGAAQGWELPITTKPFHISGWKYVDGSAMLNAENRDRKLRTELRGSIEVDDGINIDIWCNQCGLLNLPRRVPVN